MAKLVVLRKGGGGRVAINPERVAYVRSAAGAFTDVFFDGQQVAVEGSFDDIIRLLSTPERRLPPEPEPGPQEGQNGLTFTPAGR